MRLEDIEVQSFCYFISLRTGTKIVGFISFIGCLLASILTVYYLAVIAKVEKYVETILVFDLIIQIIQMCTSFFLLLGAYQEKPKLLKPWLVSTVFAVILEVFYESSLVGRYVGFDKPPSVEWFISTLLLLVDDIYGMLVVFSYYRKLTPQG